MMRHCGPGKMAEDLVAAACDAAGGRPYLEEPPNRCSVADRLHAFLAGAHRSQLVYRAAAHKPPSKPP
eukprot:11208536-Lingulodinium_polyedra.AAC.1